jgi:hypothetical protein
MRERESDRERALTSSPARRRGRGRRFVGVLSKPRSARPLLLLVRSLDHPLSLATSPSLPSLLTRSPLRPYRLACFFSRRTPSPAALKASPGAPSQQPTAAGDDFPFQLDRPHLLPRRPPRTMSAFRPTAARLLPRMTHAQAFAEAPTAALASRQAERLAILTEYPSLKPRTSDPPLPPKPYPSPLNAPLRPGRKAQRTPWLGPDDAEIEPPKPPTWVVNPLSSLAEEAAGRAPNEWFVRRVEQSGFLPVYTDVRSPSPRQRPICPGLRSLTCPYRHARGCITRSRAQATGSSPSSARSRATRPFVPLELRHHPEASPR